MGCRKSLWVTCLTVGDKKPLWATQSRCGCQEAGVDNKKSVSVTGSGCGLQEVDFSVAPLTPRVERGRVVDWSVPFTFRYTGLAVRSSSDTAYLVTALLWPFSWQVRHWPSSHAAGWTSALPS